ncbi:acyl-CoA dehydrogenase family protein [Streptacidiphilus fuscans]|uniref:Acyl-CoA dehydrogenase family protein n=1 Tax=Streptacidiphilus fuscans TaxID=2789292 RepID=A0A931BBD1_9ACTN|nr:acyl-CoA dehydrogenase family protein [Streptacidiphilus fuscans]MBF9072117.1 acyl-CoA dehydrogenase family protein [Streptacidiphilus fuscans]MBF9072928.1 acyl-CoA dehydrogenase family protein [Streptacidiphilus fuscans]
MDPALTQEQDEIARALRDALAKQAGPDEVRVAAASSLGYDVELWKRLAEQLGLAGLALPERHGGTGLGRVELALACEEAGRVLLSSPLLASSVLAAGAITACGTEEQRDALLPALASGAQTAALVLPGTPALALGLAPDPRTAPLPGDVPSGGGRAGGVQAKPVPSAEDGSWSLYGEAEYALDGARADLLVVAAHTGGFPRSRTVLFVVPADTPGVHRERSAGIDQTRSVGRVELRDVPAQPLGDPTVDVGPALTRLGREAAIAVAAEAVGAAAQALARTVEYVQVRQQFGRAIGSFQAVKHRLADVYVAVETARSAMLYAAWAGPDQPVPALLALAHALTAQRVAAAEAIQLHGGIAITWEHDAHLYFKRAAADELLFGPPHLLRARAAELAGVLAGGEPR